MHFFYNRQICPLEGFIVSADRLSCPPPLPLVQTPASKPLKSPPSPHQLYDLQEILDELMHFLPQLSYFVHLKNGFYMRTDCLTSPC